MNVWIDWIDSKARVGMVVSRDGGRVPPVIPAYGARVGMVVSRDGGRVPPAIPAYSALMVWFLGHYRG